MYKKILLPIDGSKISTDAAKAGVEYAKKNNATIVLFSVVQPYVTAFGFSDGMAASFKQVSADEYDDNVKKAAQKHIDAVVAYASEAGVTATSDIVADTHIAEAIIDAAKKNNCDLIFIATHGRTGLKRMMLGSVTSKVITLAPVSVHVYRQ